MKLKGIENTTTTMKARVRMNVPGERIIMFCRKLIKSNTTILFFIFLPSSKVRTEYNTHLFCPASNTIPVWTSKKIGREVKEKKDIINASSHP